MWFSYGWDLTNSLQRQEEGQAGGLAPAWKKADDRFFWNRYLMRGLIEQTERGGKENDVGLGKSCAARQVDKNADL